MSPRSARTRSAGIVIKDDNILLMYRKKEEKEYYTFPGGGVEEGEGTKDAVLREIFEETAIIVTVGALRYELHREGGGMQEYFYVCTYISGAPTLPVTSIEYRIQNAENIYLPLWVPIDTLTTIELLPPEVASQYVKDLAEGFNDNPVLLQGSSIGI